MSVNKRNRKQLGLKPDWTRRIILLQKPTDVSREGFDFGSGYIKVELTESIEWSFNVVMFPVKIVVLYQNLHSAYLHVQSTAPCLKQHNTVCFMVWDYLSMAFIL